MKDTSSAITEQAAPRFDIYALIHKALRAFMCDTLTAVGRADADDDSEVEAALAGVRGLADFCETHLRHENEFVHTALETRRLGASTHTAEDHRHHEWAIGQMRALVEGVEEAAAGTRAAALSRLYRYLALFVADNFTHMNVEETDNNAVLWATYTDEELISIERALIAKLKPEEMAVGMHWMIAAMTPKERAAKLGGIRQGAPAPVFESVLAIARTHLPERDWRKLWQALLPADRLAA